jgi:adhesin isopeptide-forming family sspB-C2 type protein
MTAFDNEVGGSHTYKHAGVTYTATSKFNDKKTSIESIAQTETSGGEKSSVIIVLAQNEPAPRTYTLKVTTKQVSGFTQSNGTAKVHDSITTSNSLGTKESVAATIYLNWDGYPATSTVHKKISKKLTLSTNAKDQVSPSFSPSDFGWKQWAAGRYWYSVTVSKQKNMSAKVAAKTRVAAETWSAAPIAPTKSLSDGNGNKITSTQQLAADDYATAVIGAHSAGASKMWLSDTVNTKDVYFGAAGRDDLSKVTVTDPDGKTVKATITVSSTDTSRTVLAEFSPGTGVTGNFQLHAPEYAKATGKNYSLPDTGKVCYVTNSKNCQTTPSKTVPKITPSPDKAWVLDANGALTANDPKWTNTVAVDGDTFTAGDPISAVVNGSFPKGLVHDLKSYTLTDDWTAAAKYVDFTDASKAKVYVDEVDHTSDFTITVNGTTTTATAKAAILKGTANLSAEKVVTLVVSGNFKKDADTAGKTVKLTNGGSETWNTEKKPTNEPPVFIRTPKPDKSWVLNEKGALTTADPNRTNTTGVDGKTFTGGDSVSAVVNGTLPGNLGSALKAYSLADDWTNANKYVDFSDASKVKVYIDGVDHTDDFTISVKGTVTTATAKAALLKTTTGQAKDRVVKLVITGTFRLALDTNGKEEKLTNGGSEAWNNTPHETNEPPVFVRTPKPNKVWVLDNEGGLRATDEGWTNTKEVDGRTFVPGMPISAVVNGKLPKNLATDLTAYELTDDWTAAAKYVDFSDATKAKVYVDGVDRTQMFTITTVGTTTVATAKAGELKGTAGLKADKVVKLVISGRFRSDYSTNAKVVQLTNGGSEKWNNEKKPTNDPPVFTWTPVIDKSWIKKGADGKFDAVIDPSKTNKTGIDNLTLLNGDEVASAVNGLVPANLGEAPANLSFVEDYIHVDYMVDPEVKNIKVYAQDVSDTTKATVANIVDTGTDVTNMFTVSQSGTKITITAKAEYLKTLANLAKDKQISSIIPFTVNYANGKGAAQVRKDFGVKDSDGITFCTNPENGTAGTQKLVNAATETIQEGTANSNQPGICGYVPSPDKSWVKTNTDGTHTTVTDTTWSNKTGIDGQTLLDGDTLAAVINEVSPANTAYAPSSFAMTDDYAAIDYLLDPVASGAKIYMADDANLTESSVNGMLAKGTDVTSHFKLAANGTKVTWTMDDSLRNTLGGLAKAKQFTLVIPFTVNYANGKGAKQVREDFGKQPGDELTFCTTPTSDHKEGAKFSNTGYELLPGDSEKTNMPPICGYIPPVHKDVVAESSQGGDQSSIDGMKVGRGQKVEYKLETSPKLPSSLVYDISKVAVTDSYDEITVPSKQTLEITDLGMGTIIPKSQYKTVWNDAAHNFVVTFSDAYVQKNWNAGSNPRILVRFEATVKTDAPLNEFDNGWDLTLNNSITPSNIVNNTPIDPKPSKQDTQSDPSITIDGKNAFLDDVLYYRLNLDAKSLSDTAYNVMRLGMVDDFDDEYLQALTDQIKVLDAKGADVTNKFNIGVEDGVLYVFFKTVDTEIPATGETVKGDPQPTNLKAYSTKKLNAKVYDPETDDYVVKYDPAIDQSVLGQNYQVVLPVKVIKVTDGKVVKNTATQITNDQSKITNTVTNPLPVINPKKDVVINVGGESHDGGTIIKGSTFEYRLDSSAMPGNRAYPQISNWDIADDYDETHDMYMGQWAVYATEDIVDTDGTVLYAKADLVTVDNIQQPTVAERKAGTAKTAQPIYFTVTVQNGAFEAHATDAYLKLATANDKTTQQWTLYVQFMRITTGDVTNQFDETINHAVRHSNIVTTTTPDSHPAIDVEKFDVKGGLVKGDRDKKSEPLLVDGDTTIGFQITNTGDETLHRLTLSDRTIAGTGAVKDIQYPANWDTLELKPGESITIYGTLTGVKEGDTHTDDATVYGTPEEPCPVLDMTPFDGVDPEVPEGTCDGTPVTDHDSWNGRRTVSPITLAATGIDLRFIAVASLLGGALGFGILQRKSRMPRHAASSHSAQRAKRKESLLV